MERYFNPEVMREENELRHRVWQKLKLCPEQYLPIVEGVIDGDFKIEKPNEEVEGVWTSSVFLILGLPQCFISRDKIR